MKKSITILSALLISVISFIQAQDCLWVKSAGGTSLDYGTCVTTDASGNLYMTGYFDSPTINFGSTTVTNLGGFGDIFIAKFDASGNVLWAKSAGGDNNDVGYSISADSSGNIYLAGCFFSSTITFGSTTLTNNSLGFDIFIVKYDASGNVLWAKSAGGTGPDIGFSISTDASDNVYMSGRFDSPTISFGSTTLTNAGSNDIFIVKYDAAGNLLWAKSVGGYSTDCGNSVSTDASGNVYISGYFGSPSITFGSITIINEGGIDIFITKYDADGNVLWAKAEGGTYYDYSNSVSCDATGNVYITGKFKSPTLMFGSTILTNADSSGNNEDIFIAKYDAAGNALWVNSVGGTNNDEAYSISADASGNVYISGRYSSPTITFGSTALANAVNTTNSYDIFIAKYDAAGNVLWAESAGGTDDDYGKSVLKDASGNVYMTGRFISPTIAFGSTTLTNADSTGNNSDIFIAKYSGTGTGVEERFGNNELNISPNPTNGKFTINLKFKVQSAKLLIVDVFGKEVYTTQINTESTEVDLSGIAKGLYFVNVGGVVKKLVLE